MEITAIHIKIVLVVELGPHIADIQLAPCITNFYYKVRVKELCKNRNDDVKRSFARRFITHRLSQTKLWDGSRNWIFGVSVLERSAMLRLVLAKKGIVFYLPMAARNHSEYTRLSSSNATTFEDHSRLFWSASGAIFTGIV